MYFIAVRYILGNDLGRQCYNYRLGLCLKIVKLRHKLFPCKYHALLRIIMFVKRGHVTFPLDQWGLSIMVLAMSEYSMLLQRERGG